jgi:hypothetical protein
VYQLPLLSSGKALSFLAREDSIAFNLAPFGIPFKLAFLGLQIGDPWKVAKLVNQAFTVIIVIFTFFAARKNGPPQVRAVLWLTVLTLGTLRSPYAPAYVTFPLFWLLSLWSIEIRGAVGTILLAMVWVFLSATMPLSPTATVIASLVQQSVLMGLLVYAVFRKHEPSSAEPNSR